MMKFKSLFRRSQQGHQKQHRRLRHNNNNTHPQVGQPQQHQAAPKSSSTISLFKEQPNNRSEGSTLAGAASCWGSVTTLSSSTSTKNQMVKNQTLPKDFNRMQHLDGAVQSNDMILMEKHKTELMWLKEQHRIEIEHLAKEIENLRTVLRNATRSDTPSEANACFQDKIPHIEENRFADNEELQNTIHKLTDLQDQLMELQVENERLTEEKSVLLDSLCRQSEKLEDSRNQVGNLQEALLLKEENAEKQAKGYNTEREQKLVDLLKSAQEERETLLHVQDQLKTEIRNLYTSADGSSDEVNRLTKLVKNLNAEIEGTNIEKQHLDRELRKAKQEITNQSIEISRLNNLLDSLRVKILELEKPNNLENKKDVMDERLETAKREKEKLENQTDSLMKELSEVHCENEGLKSQYAQIQEEFEVSKNIAKTNVEVLENLVSKLKEEKVTIATELQLVRDSLLEWQNKCQRHLEEKRELKNELSELQRRDRDVQARHLELESTVQSEREAWRKEREEWQQFQTDLLMTVRVANDFKTEAQDELERVSLENTVLQNKVRNLESQLEKLKNLASQKNNLNSPPKLTTTTTMTTNTTIATKDDVINNELLMRRKVNAARQDSRLSVKCLIESIENATKQAKTGSF